MKFTINKNKKLLVIVILKLFEQNMDSYFYENIIYDNLLPYVAEFIGEGAKLHQDNDTKHSSLLCKRGLENIRVDWVRKTFIIYFLNIYIYVVLLNDVSKLKNFRNLMIFKSLIYYKINV